MMLAELILSWLCALLLVTLWRPRWPTCKKLVISLVLAPAILIGAHLLVAVLKVLVLLLVILLLFLAVKMLVRAL